jgi:outer membrane protein assembly factor BamB
MTAKRGAGARRWIACLAAGLSAGSCREPTAPPPAPVTRWLASQTGYPYARPAVSGSLVYFGTGDGQLIARDVTTGQERWSVAIGVEMIAGANLLVRSGTVVAPITGYTSGVDETTGRELWRYVSPLDTVASRGGGVPPNAGYLVKTHIDADDQTVYIPAWGASISAVDLRTGVARWVWRPGASAGDTAMTGPFRSGAEGVRLSGDTLFATVWHHLTQNGVTAEAWLVALDRATGRELWRVVMPSYTGGLVVQGAPALHGNLVIFTSAGGYCYAIDRTTRQIAWQYTPRPQHTTSAQAEVVGDVVYIDGGDDNVRALGAADGVEQWHTQVGVQLTTDFLATTRRLVFGSGRYLIVLNREDGREVLRVTQPDVSPDESLFATTPIARGTQLFVGMNGAAWSFEQP